MARFRDVMTSFTRNYIPGGPLYAAGAIKFQGVQYRQDDPLPVGKMSKARHQRLFITRKANHVPTRKTARVVPALAITTSLAELTESELERMTAPALVPMGAVLHPGGEKRTILIDGTPVELTAGPTISVATPEQQRQTRSQRKR